MTGRTPTRHEQLQGQVVELLGLVGWKHLHVRKSIGKGKRWVTTTNVVGWPDLFCWSPRHPGRHVAIEIKVPPDKLSPDQEAVRDDLVASGIEYLVVTPTTDLQALARDLRRQV